MVHRPALVLSTRDFNIATGLAAVCPLTNTQTGSKFEVPVPRGTRLTGVVLSHQFRTVDWIDRKAAFHSKANDDLLRDVLQRIEAILGIEISKTSQAPCFFQPRLAPPSRSPGGAISVTRSRTSGLLESGASSISRGSSRARQA